MLISRRRFLQSGGAALLGNVLVNRDGAIARATPSRSLQPAWFGPHDLEKPGALLFDHAVAASPRHISVHSTTSAIERVASRGFSIACCDGRDLVAAVAGGAPLISVAQLAKGPSRKIAIRKADGGAEDVDSLKSRRLLAKSKSDRRFWKEIGATSAFEPDAFTITTRPWYRALISGEADAALVTPLEEAEAEGYGYPFRFISPAGHNAHPLLCVVARRDCLWDEAQQAAVAQVLRDVAVACAAFDRDRAAQRLFDTQLHRHHCGEHMALRFVARTMSARTAGTTGQLGRHDGAGWRALYQSVASASPLVREAKVRRLFTDRFLFWAAAA